jgi:hypothetical protein
MAGEEAKYLPSNVETVSRMPVAFGFHLNNGHLSTELGRSKAAGWNIEGLAAAESEEMLGLFVSRKDKKNKTGSKTPNGKRKSNGGGGTGTPRPPKTPATLISTDATPNLPEGWVSKTYRRTSGVSVGRPDTYFFSPQKELRFRSMKSCRTFIQIMEEPGVNGDEAIALKVYKARGHKI